MYYRNLQTHNVNRYIQIHALLVSSLARYIATGQDVHGAVRQVATLSYKKSDWYLGERAV